MKLCLIRSKNFFKLFNNEKDDKEKTQKKHFTRENKNVNDNCNNSNNQNINISKVKNFNNVNNFFNIQSENHKSYLTIKEEIKKSLLEELKNNLQINESEVFSFSAVIDSVKKKPRRSYFIEDSKGSLIINGQKIGSMDYLYDISETNCKNENTYFDNNNNNNNSVGNNLNEN